MKLLLFFLILINASRSPNLSPCEFFSPLAQMEIVEGTKLLHFSNDTYSIPMQKIASGERSNLYFTDDDLFYWDSIGLKKFNKKKVMRVAELIQSCDCMNELVTKNPNAKFIVSQAKRICNESKRISSLQSDLFLWSPEGWNNKPFPRPIGRILDFDHLKRKMPIEEIEQDLVTEDQKAPKNKKNFRSMPRLG